MHIGQESPENASEPAPATVQPARSARAIPPDEALLDLGDDAPQFTGGGEDEFVLDIWDDSPELAQSANIATTGNQVFQYNGNVTELSEPAAEHLASEIIETAPQVDATPVSEFDVDTVSVEPVVDARESALSHTGMITLGQVSPEVIDAIARRAVEQLSERVVERIAWEVVPELAERLIRRHLEEERKQ